MSEPKPCETEENKEKLVGYKEKLEGYKAKLEGYKANPQINTEYFNKYKTILDYLNIRIRTQNLFLQNYSCDNNNSQHLDTRYEDGDIDIINNIKELEKQQLELEKQQQQQQQLELEKQQKLELEKQQKLELEQQQQQQKLEQQLELEKQQQQQQLEKKIVKEKLKLISEKNNIIKDFNDSEYIRTSQLKLNRYNASNNLSKKLLERAKNIFIIVRINIKPKQDLLQETISLLTNQKFMTTYTADLKHPIKVAEEKYTGETPKETDRVTKPKAGKYYLYNEHAQQYYHLPEPPDQLPIPLIIK